MYSTQQQPTHPIKIILYNIHSPNHHLLLYSCLPWLWDHVYLCFLEDESSFSVKLDRNVALLDGRNGSLFYFPPSHRLSLSHSVSCNSQIEERKEGMRKKEKGEERTKEEVCDMKRDIALFYNCESNECRS